MILCHNIQWEVKSAALQADIATYSPYLETVVIALFTP